MKQKKYTKRALCMSLLSMLLCCSMLIGTTFAWFTDSVTSGKNQIVAGNLDVELEHSTDGKTWEKVDTETDLFKADTLWEPGHTEYVYLRVRNAGTLALKYNLSATVYGSDDGTAPEAEYTNMNSEKVKLSSYLIFNVIEGTAPVTDRSELWLDATAEEAAMGKLDSLNTEDAVLYPAGDTDPTHTSEKTFTLAVYMPTSVGNEANWIGAEKATGETAPTIYLGLMLNATQTPYEADSFDENYDETAELPKVAFDTDGLVGALHEGGSIVLGGSSATLLLDTHTEGPGDKGTISDDEMVTEDVSIDLNGHTLLAGENQAYDSISTSNPMFGSSNFSMKNGTYLMERAKFSGSREVSRALTFRVGEEGTGPCNISFENVVFKNEVRQSKSFVTNRILPAIDFALRGYEETTITFKDCTFEDVCVIFDDWNYRYIGDVGPTIVFDNCTFNVSAGSGGTASASGGSVIVFNPIFSGAASNAHLTIRDCTINYTSTNCNGAYAVDIVTTVNVALEGHNILNGIAAEPHTADESKGEWKNYDDIVVREVSGYDPENERYKYYDNKPFVSFALTIPRAWTGLDTLEYQNRAFEKYPNS